MVVLSKKKGDDPKGHVLYAHNYSSGREQVPLSSFQVKPLSQRQQRVGTRFTGTRDSVHPLCFGTAFLALQILPPGLGSRVAAFELEEGFRVKNGEFE
jgi:hypothetical protein